MAYLVDDLFESITLYDNRAINAVAHKLANGKYQVTVIVHSSKLRADELGAEKEVPIHDLVEVGVDDKDGNPLIRERKLVEQHENIYKLIVNGRPGKAGIDPDNKLIDRKPDDNMIAVENL
jgi:hypothetical protein